MIQAFRLTVTDEQEISVIYQKPEDVAAPAPVAEGPAAKPINRRKGREKKAPPAPKPLIVMLHGFPGGTKDGTKDVFVQLEARMTKAGYPSVRFDFRGCGESECQPVDFCLEYAAEDIDAVVNWAKGEGHKTFVLLGEDVGGAAALMAYDATYVEALVLLWPTVVMKETAFRSMYTHEARAAADALDAPYVQYGSYRLGWPFFNEAYKTDLLPYIERIKTPTLIQHGSKDEIVPVEQAFMVRDAMRVPGEIAVFEGGDHGITKPNMRDAMFTNIEYFLTKALKRREKA